MQTRLHHTGNRHTTAPSRTAHPLRACTGHSLPHTAVAHYAEPRAGLTLLEVVLALAIFLAAVAALRQLTELGSRAAIQTDAQSTAVLRAETRLAELLAGVVPLSEASGGSFADDPRWRWQLQVQPGPHESLRTLTLTVIREQSGPQPPVRFALTRWIQAAEMSHQLVMDEGGLP